MKNKKNLRKRRNADKAYKIEQAHKAIEKLLSKPGMEKEIKKNVALLKKLYGKRKCQDV